MTTRRAASRGASVAVVSSQLHLLLVLINADEEDMGNFMIQCEQCSVWQHGVCMGVANVDESPEHYYCEQCKPENHAALLRYVLPSSASAVL